MQVWVPLLDIEQIPQVLVGQHLGAQRGEGLMALRAIMDFRRNPELRAPWVHHPAARMWRGYERAFCEYGLVICREWRSRGYNDACLPLYLEAWSSLRGPTKLPPWWGQHSIHESHQRSLITRYDWYRKVWPEQEPGEITWPVPMGARTADDWIPDHFPDVHPPVTKERPPWR